MLALCKRKSPLPAHNPSRTLIRKRFQNKIAENRFALPIVSVYALVVWTLSGLWSGQMWTTFFMAVFATYLMVELNNRNALIRIYSRMVSCSFLMLMTMSTFLFTDSQAQVVGICVIATYLLLFNGYQDRQAMGWSFYAYAAYGIGTLNFVQLFYFVPLLWLLHSSKIMGLSIRTFIASILGLTVPYWFALGYVAYIGDYTILTDHFAALWHFMPLCDFTSVGVKPLISIIFITILAIIGMFHFFTHAYQDKIRTRMLYEVFSYMDLAILLFFILQPGAYHVLIPLMIINTAPITGHFFALTHSRVSNIMFITILILMVVITGVNLWT